MGTTTETRISSTQAKDAIYKAHSISSSASEIDGGLLTTEQKKILSKEKVAQESNIKNFSLASNVGFVENGITANGVVGGVGTIYTIPIVNTGIYRMGFKVKFPSDFNTLKASKVSFASIEGYLNASNINTSGKFNILADMKKPTNEDSQVKTNSTIIFRPNQDNNFQATYTPSTYDGEKQWTGDVAFSIRYIGDITLSTNQDVNLKIDANGITLYHLSDNSIVLNEPFPADNKLQTLVNNLITKTKAAGAYNGIISFNFFQIGLDLCTDLLFVDNIPLVKDYGGTHGVDNYPYYATRIDTDWHDIEIIFNNTISNGYGMHACYIDGRIMAYWDVTIGKQAVTTWTSNLILGADGFTVKDFYFEPNISVPKFKKIFIYMAHGITSDTEGVLTSGGYTTECSLGRIENIINLHKKYDIKFVTLEEIADYYNNGAELPDRCYTIIHDDLHHLGDVTNEAVKKWRNVYLKNNMKVSFALVNMNTSETVKNNILRDRDVFGFHLHGTHVDNTLFKYNDFISDKETKLAEFRDNLFTTNIMTYPYGSRNLNVMKAMRHDCGFAIAMRVGNGLATKRHDLLSLPRYSFEDANFSLSQIEAKIKQLLRIY